VGREKPVALLVGPRFYCALPPGMLARASAEHVE